MVTRLLYLVRGEGVGNEGLLAGSGIPIAWAFVKSGEVGSWKQHTVNVLKAEVPNHICLKNEAVIMLFPSISLY